MTQDGQGTPEHTPRPPTSTRWAEPGTVHATGPVPPFIPRSRPGTGPATKPHDPGTDTTAEVPEEPDWAPPYEAEAVEGVLIEDIPDVEAADDVVEAAGEAVIDIGDATRDTDDVARDTADAVSESAEELPALEYDISGPFAPLPRDQGGWIPEDEQEPVPFEAADDWEEPATEAEEEMVSVSELPTPSETVDSGEGEYRAPDTDPGTEDSAPPEVPARPDDQVESPFAEGPGVDREPGPETGDMAAPVAEATAYAEPDLSEELADRLDALANRLRDGGADAARAEMDSYDRFTALVAGLVSGFLAGHGR